MTKRCYNSPEEADWSVFHETHVQTHSMVPRTDAEDNCDDFPAKTWNVRGKDIQPCGFFVGEEKKQQAIISFNILTDPVTRF